MNATLRAYWRSITSAIAFVTVLGGAVLAWDQVRPIVPATLGYVDNSIVVAGGDFEQALVPLRRQQYSIEVRSIESQQLDFKARKSQFDAAIKTTIDPALREALESQADELDRAIKELEAARTRALCDLLKLDGTNC